MKTKKKKKIQNTLLLTRTKHNSPFTKVVQTPFRQLRKIVRSKTTILELKLGVYNINNITNS